VLSNRNLLVTGGSRGIGAATCLRAATRGFRVVINYRTDENAARHVYDSIKTNGGDAILVQADISREDDVVRLFTESRRQFGALDGLVNNAGILERQSRVEAITAERLNRVFATNVTGTFLCCREAIRQMSTKHGGRGGSIVNVSSVAARLGAPHEYVDYAASKGAIDALTLGLSKEVADEGIRVNAVRPGFIYTDMHASGGEPGRVDRIKDTLPMKRGGHPEEVAEAILWFLSPDSSYTTGSFLELAGGR